MFERELISSSSGVNLNEKIDVFCETCSYGKQQTLPFKSTNHTEMKQGERIYSDINKKVSTIFRNDITDLPPENEEVGDIENNDENVERLNEAGGGEDVPESYTEATESKENVNWKKAIEEEIEALDMNATWKLVQLPQNEKTIDSKWVF
ncbi:hypothetical protein HHI36_017304 [Cryptolaemus montrouzieri]|uniref:Uncharacterized protein n=1 Tax=Cryptolaemus montrouzieri TaxID=559131 RepID=A0ABD2NM28_9CUCU